MKTLGTSLFLLILFTACSSAAPQPDLSVETPTSPTSPIMVGDVERHFEIYIPTTYDKRTELPLVLNFHGTGGSPAQQESLSQFEATAEAEGFIVVMPTAKYVMADSGRVTWNVDLHDSDINDVAFIRELITQLKADYRIDANRIYSTGFSGGARMSSRLACELSDQIAAIGPVAGLRFPENCAPTRAVPIITFHGMQDNVNHYVHQTDSPPYWRNGLEDALNGWVTANQCKNSEPNANVLTATLNKISFDNCAADLVFYRSSDAGHTWPGSPSAERLESFGLGTTEMAIDATAEIWKFFEANPLK